MAGEYLDNILKFVNIYIREDCELILIQKIYFDKYIFYTVENLYDDIKINKYIIEDKIYNYINNFINIKTIL